MCDILDPPKCHTNIVPTGLVRYPVRYHNIDSKGCSVPEEPPRAACSPRLVDWLNPERSFACCDSSEAPCTPCAVVRHEHPSSIGRIRCSSSRRQTSCSCHLGECRFRRRMLKLPNADASPQCFRANEWSGWNGQYRVTPCSIASSTTSRSVAGCCKGCDGKQSADALVAPRR